MKVLYVITGLGGGGAEKVVADLADQMSKRGHQVKIAYLKGAVIVRPENSEIELIYLGLESIRDAKKAYANYKALLLGFQPDVVHAHMVHANIFARLSRKLFPVPKLICTAHNSNEGGKFRMLAYKLTDSLADINTNVSTEATQRFLECGAFSKKAFTVYNGINLNNFKKSANLNKFDFIDKENQKLILAVGRFSEQKDYPNLLQAVSLLLKQENSQNFKLIIAGDGELRKSIEDSIIKLGLSDNITLLGRRNDIADLMSISDIFVLSSAWEGFGLVVAEAMACECFVVATDCGGVKEVMGGYGILVPAENSEALAEGLSDAVEMNPDLINKNNVAALDYVKYTFDLDKIVDQWLEIYVS